ncbi:MAG TPA: FmdB family zinc ribbon protein [Acidimicrobiales bacterium]|nr:FmdB family zinc ribbon protein [Acidimicrobiales bacterium]
MPTYEYECQECHERLEAVQSFSDAALTICPACGGELRKVFSAVGIVFKGSGFYKNDARATSSAGATPSSDATKKKADTPAPTPAPATPAPAAKAD